MRASALWASQCKMGNGGGREPTGVLDMQELTPSLRCNCRHETMLHELDSPSQLCGRWPWKQPTCFNLVGHRHMHFDLETTQASGLISGWSAKKVPTSAIHTSVKRHQIRHPMECRHERPCNPSRFDTSCAHVIIGPDTHACPHPARPHCPQAIRARHLFRAVNRSYAHRLRSAARPLGQPPARPHPGQPAVGRTPSALAPRRPDWPHSSRRLRAVCTRRVDRPPIRPLPTTASPRYPPPSASTPARQHHALRAARARCAPRDCPIQKWPTARLALRRCVPHDARRQPTAGVVGRPTGFRLRLRGWGPDLRKSPVAARPPHNRSLKLSGSQRLAGCCRMSESVCARARWQEGASAFDSGGPPLLEGRAESRLPMPMHLPRPSTPAHLHTYTHTHTNPLHRSTFKADSTTRSITEPPRSRGASRAARTRVARAPDVGPGQLHGLAVGANVHLPVGAAEARRRGVRADASRTAAPARRNHAPNAARNARAVPRD